MKSIFKNNDAFWKLIMDAAMRRVKEEFIPTMPPELQAQVDPESMAIGFILGVTDVLEKDTKT